MGTHDNKLKHNELDSDKIEKKRNIERTEDETIKEKQSLNLNENIKKRIGNRFSDNTFILFSAALSGFLSGIIVCPFDVVKTRLQGEKIENFKSKVNLRQEFQKIVREEGFKGLYKGLTPIMIGYFPTWTIFFFTYEKTIIFYRNLANSLFNEPSRYVNIFFAALSAGFISTLITNPIWVVKTRIVIDKSIATEDPIFSIPTFSKLFKKNKNIKKVRNVGVWSTLRNMYINEGITLFYKGLIPSMVGSLHVGIHFPLYEKLKLLFLGDDFKFKSRSKTRTIVLLVMASFYSKVIACTITYPLEILKVQLHLNLNEKTKTLTYYLRKIYKNFGFKGFYIGFKTNLIRTAPASAITLVFFESFKNFLLNFNHR